MTVWPVYIMPEYQHRAMINCLSITLIVKHICIYGAYFSWCMVSEVCTELLSFYKGWNFIITCNFYAKHKCFGADNYNPHRKGNLNPAGEWWGGGLYYSEVIGTLGQIAVCSPQYQHLYLYKLYKSNLILCLNLVFTSLITFMCVSCFSPSVLSSSYAHMHTHTPTNNTHIYPYTSDCTHTPVCPAPPSLSLLVSALLTFSFTSRVLDFIQLRLHFYSSWWATCGCGLLSLSKLIEMNENNAVLHDNEPDGRGGIRARVDCLLVNQLRTAFFGTDEKKFHTYFAHVW